MHNDQDGGKGGRVRAAIRRIPFRTRTLVGIHNEAIGGIKRELATAGASR